MSKLAEPRPGGGDPPLEPLAAVDEFRRAPVRAGCLGCTLSGWAAVVGLCAVVALLLWLARHLAR